MVINMAKTIKQIRFVKDDNGRANQELLEASITDDRGAYKYLPVAVRTDNPNLHPDATLVELTGNVDIGDKYAVVRGSHAVAIDQAAYNKLVEVQEGESASLSELATAYNRLLDAYRVLYKGLMKGGIIFYPDE